MDGQQSKKINCLILGGVQLVIRSLERLLKLTKKNIYFLGLSNTALVEIIKESANEIRHSHYIKFISSWVSYKENLI